MIISEKLDLRGFYHQRRHFRNIFRILRGEWHEIPLRGNVEVGLVIFVSKRYQKTWVSRLKRDETSILKPSESDTETRLDLEN